MYIGSERTQSNLFKTGIYRDTNFRPCELESNSLPLRHLNNCLQCKRTTVVCLETNSFFKNHVCELSRYIAHFIRQKQKAERMLKNVQVSYLLKASSKYTLYFCLNASKFSNEYFYKCAFARTSEQTSFRTLLLHVVVSKNSQQ